MHHNLRSLIVAVTALLFSEAQTANAASFPPTSSKQWDSFRDQLDFSRLPPPPKEAYSQCHRAALLIEFKGLGGRVVSIGQLVGGVAYGAHYINVKAEGGKFHVTDMSIRQFRALYGKTSTPTVPAVHAPMDPGVGKINVGLRNHFEFLRQTEGGHKIIARLTRTGQVVMNETQFRAYINDYGRIYGQPNNVKDDAVRALSKGRLPKAPEPGSGMSPGAKAEVRPNIGGYPPAKLKELRDAGLVPLGLRQPVSTRVPANAPGAVAGIGPTSVAPRMQATGPLDGAAGAMHARDPSQGAAFRHRQTGWGKVQGRGQQSGEGSRGLFLMPAHLGGLSFGDAYITGTVADEDEAEYLRNAIDPMRPFMQLSGQVGLRAIDEAKLSFGRRFPKTYITLSLLFNPPW